jgi:hypothetical protein
MYDPEHLLNIFKIDTLPPCYTIFIGGPAACLLYGNKGGIATAATS